MNKYARWILSGMLLIPLFSMATSRTGEVPYTRTVLKVFTVTDGAQLSIENKYGNIILHSWNNQEIKATIRIRVEGSTSEDAKKLANQVNIESGQSGNVVSLKTIYEPGSGSSFWKQFFGSQSKGGRKYVHIDYDVYVPESIAGTHIKNNYGNFTGDQISGDLTVNMNYGNFHIGNIGGFLNLITNYCNGTLNHIKDGKVQANYTDFNLNKVQALQVGYNYSDFKIQQGGNLKMQGNYGDIIAENISYLGAKTTYGDYKINKLSEGGNIQTTYGDVYIKSLDSHFKGLIISSTYSDIKINIPSGLAFGLNVALTHGDIRTHDLPLQISSKVEGKGKSTLKAVAKGAGNNAPLIRIAGTYSDVVLTGK